MTTLFKKDLGGEVRSRQDLIDYLRRGERPPEKWGIGMEVEKQVVDSLTGEAASYARIERLLKRLEEEERWTGVREEGHLVALIGKDSSITLEPGGQLELSGKVCPDVHCCFGELSHHIADVVNKGAEQGLSFLGMGVQPFTGMDGIDWLPKSRYEVMAPYMTRCGDMGQRMMKQSAGIQVNLDFLDEQDCIEKLRISMLASPVLYSLFANSPVMDGRPSGFLCTRGEIWSRTDPARTGLIHALFNTDAGYDTYIDYALQIPMYFIVRDGRYVDLTKTRRPFSLYMKEGFNGHRATVNDWDLHLSTIFPEARLRPQIEIRSADSLPPDLIPAVGALMKGLVYDKVAGQEFLELLHFDSDADLKAVYRSSWKLGLKTPVKGRTLREVSLDAIAISRRGLKRQRKKDNHVLDESIYLDKIEEIAESGVTLAERILDRWKGSQEDKLKMLIEHCGYR